MPRHRPNRVRTMLAAGAALLLTSIVTEFAGLQWWSSADLSKLQQTYVILRSGHIIVGQRGTAGFFNRRIPGPGMSAYWPRDYSPQSWKNRVLIMTHSWPQNQGFSVPLLSPGLIFGAIGCGMAWRNRPPRKGLCMHCGYDLAGLKGVTCPECGRPSFERAAADPSMEEPSGTSKDST